MSFDSAEGCYYTVDDMERTEQEVREDTMIVFLSFPNNTERYRKIARILRDRGLIVRSNVETRSELRLSRIEGSDAYVHFGTSMYSSSGAINRQIEFGYALACEIPVAYVGKPVTELHRFGDVFDDIDDFLAEYYSDEYFDRASDWFPDLHEPRPQEIA